MNNKKIINAEILEVLEDDKYICCKNCGLRHLKITSNCCWISCNCGKRICGSCGKDNIVNIDNDDLDLSEYSDDNYWCCEKCDDCGLSGCAMCI